MLNTFRRRRAEREAATVVSDALRGFEVAARNMVSTVRNWPSDTLQRIGVSLVVLEAASDPAKAADVLAWLEEFVADAHGVETLRALAVLHLGPVLVGQTGEPLDRLADAR